MAGLYVHIPFCAQACTYCDFHFTTNLRDRKPMVEALRQELRMALPAWRDETFTTLYFGGGTPSVLSPEDLQSLAQTAFEEADWALKEWTVEANPEDLGKETLDRLRGAGVNRLSIGVQSFQPDVLRWMNRVHDANRAEQAVRDASSAGFEHVSLDLIYGLPVGEPNRWASDLAMALSLPVDHLSAYILTAEPKTLYGHQLTKGDLVPPPDELVLDEYALLTQRTADQGFEHYEVSSFAKVGGQSQHNSAYWDGIPYLGIGPGAHSFRQNKRWWNPRSNARYIRAAEAETLFDLQESETLSLQDRFNEALITGLRRREGVDPITLKAATGIDLTAQPAWARLIAEEKMAMKDGRCSIPSRFWPEGDTLTLALMV